MHIALIASLAALCLAPLSTALVAGTSAERLRADATQLFELGKYEEALSRFEEAEKADPSHDGFSFLEKYRFLNMEDASPELRADEKRQRDLTRRAGFAMGRSAKRHPERADVYAATQLLASNGELDAALELAAGVRKAAPENFEATRAEMVAFGMRAIERPDQAADAAKRMMATADTIVENNGDAEHAYAAGVMLLEVGTKSSAPQDVKKALLERAGAAFDRALELRPAYFEAQVYRSVLLREKAKHAPPAEAAKLNAEADRARAAALETRAKSSGGE